MISISGKKAKEFYLEEKFSIPERMFATFSKVFKLKLTVHCPKITRFQKTLAISGEASDFCVEKTIGISKRILRRCRKFCLESSKWFQKS